MHGCTTNHSRGEYCQSQSKFLLEIASQDDVNKCYSIPMCIAPARVQNIDFSRHSLPYEIVLRNLGWRELNIGCVPEKIILARGGLQTKCL